MKYLFLLFLGFSLLAACSNQPVPQNAGQTPVSQDSNTDILVNAYTGSFQIGNPKFAKIVLDFYKNYDANTISNISGYISDTLKMNLSDGKQYDCSQDSAIKVLQQMRNSLQISRTIPDAYVTVTFANLPGTWVSVWGKRIAKKNNAGDTLYFNENWKFNDSGKLVVRNEYIRKPAP